MSYDRDDVPFFELEGFDLEVAEGDGLVEVGAVYALEGTYALGSLMMVVEGVGQCDTLAEGRNNESEQQDKDKLGQKVSTVRFNALQGKYLNVLKSCCCVFNSVLVNG